VLAAQRIQLQNQKAGISALRHQRHDILNDITLASSYIQLGKIEHAQKCLDFVAANMSDRYNFNSLPNLAWETVIEHKTAQAKKSGIALKINIEAPPPCDEHEQRLLPKLINNLADNAFEAAVKGDKPSVIVEWISEQNARVLRVKNNGATIREEDVDKIFLPGFTSHPGLGRGWGLAICLKIADELGGTITVTIGERWTEFIFLLPTVSLGVNKPA